MGGAQGVIRRTVPGSSSSRQMSDKRGSYGVRPQLKFHPLYLTSSGITYLTSEVSWNIKQFRRRGIGFSSMCVCVCVHVYLQVHA